MEDIQKRKIYTSRNYFKEAQSLNCNYPDSFLRNFKVTRNCINHPSNVFNNKIRNIENFSINESSQTNFKSEFIPYFSEIFLSDPCDRQTQIFSKNYKNFKNSQFSNNKTNNYILNPEISNKMINFENDIKIKDFLKVKRKKIFMKFSKNNAHIYSPSDLNKGKNLRLQKPDNLSNFQKSIQSKRPFTKNNNSNIHDNEFHQRSSFISNKLKKRRIVNINLPRIPLANDILKIEKNISPNNPSKNKTSIKNISTIEGFANLDSENFGPNFFLSSKRTFENQYLKKLKSLMKILK